MARFSRIGSLITGAVLLLGMVGSAEAALITQTYNFTASGFFPSNAPVATVTGSITVTFNNSNDIGDTTSGVTVNSLNIPVDSPVGIHYATLLDELTIGGTEAMVRGAQSNTNDFYLVMTNASTAAPTNFQFTYTIAGGFDFFSRNISVTVSTPTAIPESSSFVLLAGGLFAMWLVRRRKMV